MAKIRYSNINIINLLIASIIPCLILGPFFPDLIVSLSVLIFLFYTFKSNNFYYLNHKPFILFLFFWVFCLIGSLESDNILFSVKSSLFYIRIGVFSCLIFYLIDKDRSLLKYFYYFLILCFMALIIDGYYQYFTEENLLGMKINGIRVSSFFGDELVMGSYLSRLFPLLFALFLIKKKNKKFEIYLIGLLFILVDILIFMSGERIAFFFLNLSTIFIIVLINTYKKFRIVTFLIAMICIIILSYNSALLKKRMFLTPAKNMGLIKDSSDLKTNITKKLPIFFTPVHDSHFRTALKMFKDKTILGHGPKTFRIHCSNPKYSTGDWPCSNHPHNFYIQLLSETGIIGFGFLFTSFIYVLYCSYRQIKSIILKEKKYLNDYQVCLLAGILISTWPFSPNGNFFNNWLAILYSLPVGFYLHSIFGKKK